MKHEMQRQNEPHIFLRFLKLFYVKEHLFIGKQLFLINYHFNATYSANIKKIYTIIWIHTYVQFIHLKAIFFLPVGNVFFRFRNLSSED